MNEQNAQFAAGKVGQAPVGRRQDLVYTITTKGRLTDPKEFEEIIVRANPDGSIVRLGDVARVELGSKDYEFIGRYNGQPATLVGIFLQPGANALDVAKAVKTEVSDSWPQRFPPGFTYAVPYDTTRFVEVSIREVMKTLGEAMILVFLVVYLFLQSWRATLIPFAAVPVSLIGTFAGHLLPRLLDQHAHALRHGAVDRHRGRRRDRRAGERRAHHARGGPRAARRRDQGDARGDRPDHRDRADARRGVRADRVPRAASRASSIASSR